jgi:hypothetical protein
MADESMSDKLRGYAKKAGDYISSIGESKDAKDKREKATAEGKKRTADDKEALGDLSQYNKGIIATRQEVPEHHKGGKVKKAKKKIRRKFHLKKNEAMARLKEGETVRTKGQENKLPKKYRMKRA